jgi:putative hydrolase of the HAD superfamily
MKLFGISIVGLVISFHRHDTVQAFTSTSHRNNIHFLQRITNHSPRKIQHDYSRITTSSLPTAPIAAKKIKDLAFTDEEGDNTTQGNANERLSSPPQPPARLVSATRTLGRSFNVASAELMPQNKGRIPKSRYVPPQGEVWKEGIFPKDPPRLITIDPFDTIIQLKSEVGWFYRDILQEATDYNARLLPPEHFTAAFQKAFDQVQQKYPCFGVKDGLTSKEWWMKVTKLAYEYSDITEPGLKEDLQEWLIDDVFDVLFHDVFMTEEAWEIRPGAVEALSFYKKWRDDPDDGPIGLVVLTNYDERMHAILDELDLLDVFDCVLTSREIGAELPNRAAFQVAMSRFGITDPARCMHISASFKDGVAGASGAGWHPVYLPVTGEQDVPPGTDPEIVFSMFGDMFGVLHVWDRDPENRLIDTTRPVLENGVFGFHEKIWDDVDEQTSSEDEAIYLPPSDRTKSWEGPGRF